MLIQAICLLSSLAFILHPIDAHSTYHSQNSQDRILNETFFHGQSHGTFVDIGAYDGKTISNTYFYESELGWSGVCVEPLPKAYKKLKRNRSCKTINCAIGGENKIVKFLEMDSKNFPELAMLSGELCYFPAESLQHYENFLAKYDGKCRIFDVQMRTLNDILEESHLYHIDLLSMDIEGGELKVLKTLDFDKFKIRVILVENNERENNPLIQEFLESKRFRFVMRLDQDEVYENLEF